MPISSLLRINRSNVLLNSMLPSASVISSPLEPISFWQDYLSFIVRIPRHRCIIVIAVNCIHHPFNWRIFFHNWRIFHIVSILAIVWQHFRRRISVGNVNGISMNLHQRISLVSIFVNKILPVGSFVSNNRSSLHFIVINVELDNIISLVGKSNFLSEIIHSSFRPVVFIQHHRVWLIPLNSLRHVGLKNVDFPLRLFSLCWCSLLLY